MFFIKIFVLIFRVKYFFLGDYYVLNGIKFWIINGFDVDIFIVYVKIDLFVVF